jgi:UDP-glucose 4-epimerase
MRVLITGGAGFIGTHLANRLYRLGHYVRVLDDLSSGDPAGLQPGIFFKRGDVRDIPTLWSLLHDVDVVYHLAAKVSVPASVLYPREYNDVNVGGTVALLEACRDVGVGRVILGSSATVYGNQSKQPVREDAKCFPAVPYAVSKMAAEQYLFTMGDLIGFETVALRIFNAFGPGQQMPPTHAPVIPYAMRQIMQGGSVIIYGSGEQSRDFVYIDDVVDALVAAAVASKDNVNQQVINVGRGEGITINELIELIGKIVNKSPKVLHNREASGGIQQLVADISKASNILGYRPKVSLEGGLRKFFKEDPRFRKGNARSRPQPHTMPYPSDANNR